jgi:O-antigen/teichoic acid export membrane protein
MAFRKLVLSTLLIRFLAFPLGIWTSVLTYRALGPEARGLLAYVVFLLGFVTSFSDLGSSAAGVYLVGSRTLSLKEFKQVIETLIAAVTLAAWGVSVYYFWFHLEGDAAQAYTGIREMLLVVIPLAVFSQLWSGVVYAENRIGVFNRSQVAVQVVGAVLLTCAFAVHRLTFRFAFLTILVSHVVQAAYLFQASRPILFSRIPWMQIKRVFSLGAINYAGNLASYGTYRSSYYFIANELGAKALGVYSLAVLLSEKLLDLTNALSIVLFPQVANISQSVQMRERTNRIARVSFLCTLLFSIVAIPISPFVIRLMYGPSYETAATCFVILLPGTLFLALGKIVSAHLCGEGKIANTCYPGMVLLVPFALALWLSLEAIGIVGAAYLTSLTYVITGLWLLISYQRHTGLGFRAILWPRTSDLEGCLRWK